MLTLKKSLSIIFVIVMALSVFAGCTSNTEQQETTSVPVEEVTAAPEVSDEIIMKDPVAGEELGSGDVKWSEEETNDGFMVVTNEGGAILSYSPDSGVELIQVDGYAFKDLNKNDMLDQYEDWREPIEARTQNAASLLTIEDIAGLMLYSSHQSSIGEELNEDQIAFLENGGRAVLNAASATTADVTAKWNNALQAYAESTTFGIPVNTSSDPRSTGVSLWPSNLALAATFDPEVAELSGESLSQEYRLLGIGTYLGPQIDLSTEPRWVRNEGTFGEDPALSSDMTNAFVSGMQSTYDADGTDLGWGEDSMNAMVKHWPGDGAGEGGRESHSKVGNGAVYPGDAFETHLIPFVDAGFDLDSKTGSATAVMASYSIAYGMEEEQYGEEVGSAFSEYKINDVLRGEYSYEGVVCTDWAVLNGPDDTFGGFDMWTSWGAEDMTTPERIYTVIMAGVDQFGGYNSSAEVLEAYEIGIEEIGEEAIDARYRESAVRLLRNVFTIGLFENSYTDSAKAAEVVGNEEFVQLGYEAQQKSVVVIKNANNAIKESTTDEKQTVYIPMVYSEGGASIFGTTPASWSLPVDIAVASEYFNVVTDELGKSSGEADADGNATWSINDIVRASAAELAQCDYALPIISNPQNAGDMFGGYGYNKTTSSYIPMSLQYGEYAADSEYVRTESISGEIVEVEEEGVYGVQITEEKENRSYFGQTAKITNASDLDAVLYAGENMPEGKPVIVVINTSSSLVVSEFESQVDSIVLNFGVSDKAVFDVVSGQFEPSGLLPLQFPASMEAVEAQYEDVPRDMECYVDSVGNTYDFTFGLNWSGAINDERVQTYKVDALVSPN